MADFYDEIERAMKHDASMFVPRSQNKYLMRTVEIQDIILDNMRKATNKIHEENRLRRSELKKSRRMRKRNVAKERSRTAAIVGCIA